MYRDNVDVTSIVLP